MLNRLPTYLPPLSMMLADIGSPPAKQLAKALGVSTRTVARWMADDDAPRTALLSIFWLTRWGMSLTDCELQNWATLNVDLARSLKGRIAELHLQMERLGRIADFGSANDPMPGVPCVPPAKPPRLPTPAVALPSTPPQEPGEAASAAGGARKANR